MSTPTARRKHPAPTKPNYTHSLCLGWQSHSAAVKTRWQPAVRMAYSLRWSKVPWLHSYADAKFACTLAYDSCGLSKVSESSPIPESQSKRPRVADSLKKCEEVEGGEQEWKRQKNGPLQDRGKMEFVLYKVVETEWVEAHYHLLRIRKMTMSRTIRNMTSSRSDTRHFARNTG
jgi:hypothetical protein